MSGKHPETQIDAYQISAQAALLFDVDGSRIKWFGAPPLDTICADGHQQSLDVLLARAHTEAAARGVSLPPALSIPGEASQLEFLSQVHQQFQQQQLIHQQRKKEQMQQQQQQQQMQQQQMQQRQQ